jgi:dihydroxy-acid dehydratase
MRRLPRRRFLRGNVHGQYHEQPDGGPGNVAAVQRQCPGGFCRTGVVGQAERLPSGRAGQKRHQTAGHHDPEAFENTIAVDMALGGSTNTALHIPAIAYYAGVDLTLKDFDAFSARIPHLTSIAPVGPHHVVDLFYAGGIPAILAELNKSGLIAPRPMTVFGKPLGEMLEEIQAGIKDLSVIRSVANPVHKTGGLAVLTGNLAPDGAIVKQAAVAEEMLQHSGPARIFDSEEAAFQAIVERRIKKGDVIVVRYEGPKEGPACRKCSRPHPPWREWEWIKKWL